mmetsp:Transcript_102822/g.265804  ORF Transcript_102822/g.265804 Transcript_102822/m.265804 type:complete len:234 (-) Transcript_102822:213-914(-)
MLGRSWPPCGRPSMTGCRTWSAGGPMGSPATAPQRTWRSRWLRGISWIRCGARTARQCCPGQALQANTPYAAGTLSGSATTPVSESSWTRRTRHLWWFRVASSMRRWGTIRRCGGKAASGAGARSGHRAASTAPTSPSSRMRCRRATATAGASCAQSAFSCSIRSMRSRSCASSSAAPIASSAGRARCSCTATWSSRICEPSSWVWITGRCCAEDPGLAAAVRAAAARTVVCH